jgi:iron-sulfur cluster repair protein YtfE (RIC family)
MLNQTQIGAMLHQAHMATIEALQQLEEFLGARGVPAMDDAARRFLETLARTMREEVEVHFGFEEGHLFPVFLSQGENGMVMMLTHEHRSILPLALQVAELAQAAVAAGGFAEETWREFRDSGSELIEREIFHVQKEEMGLLAAVSALVDPETDAKLAETYRKLQG